MNEAPKYFCKHVGMSVDEVYEKWQELGLIELSQDGNYWIITDYGQSLGGRISERRTKYSGGTPTFDYEKIKHLF